ncbi:MAG: tRNA guanosine(34) transglycosylase Tgt [Hyphomicrobiales bacterium]|nr:tRNA guanosine(34) transglycosylase Tgt [Hyphomicrobiales bacterium]
MNSSVSAPFSFRLTAADGAARAGEVATAHGVVHTPAFMPVGTQASIKGVHHDDVRASGAEILLGNTYHLMLRPGAERIAALGGLHAFMRWPHPILTDSGGFQVMSLAALRKVSERGVTFRSHLDGAMIELTPERAIEVQILLGSDIAMQLDECVRLPAERSEIERAMQLSLRWAERCKRAFEKAAPGRALFGIVQGGDDPELREQSARALADIGFPGYAIGGLAVGETQKVMLDIVAETAAALPTDRPRYLMGVGTPADILYAVARGVDMFDCVLPTRNGRHGLAFTRFGPINIKNALHAGDPRPLDPDSNCPAARDFSRAYLHHLFRAGEALGGTLLSIVNLYYYQELMAGIRAAIAAGRFADYLDATMRQWAAKTDRREDVD